MVFRDLKTWIDESWIFFWSHTGVKVKEVCVVQGMMQMFGKNEI